MSGAGWKQSLPLPASVRLVWHEAEPYPRDVPIGEFYSHPGFPHLPGAMPYLVANMVTTLNGEAAVGGRASTIGTPVDALALTRLRTAADAVLTGIGTLLAEDVTAVLPGEEAERRMSAGRPRRLVSVILMSGRTLHPSILTRRFFTDPRFDRLVITGTQGNPQVVGAVKQRGIEVVPVACGADGRPDPVAALRLLGDRGARVVVSEGGPHVLASLLRARLVHEYFQTQSPLATGVPGALRPIMGDQTGEDRPLLLSRMSRYEYTFTDPATGARLVEAYERFRVVYPQASSTGSANHHREPM